jgi:quinol monooxygenase YgiN
MTDVRHHNPHVGGESARGLRNDDEGERQDQVIIAIGDIYAQIPRREEVRDLMRATQSRTRELPGCVSYTFAETLDDPGHFVVVQEWRDRAALDEHYRSQAFVSYQAKIGELLVRASELRLHTVRESLRPVPSLGGDPRHDD